MANELSAVLFNESFTSNGIICCIRSSPHQNILAIIDLGFGGKNTF